VQAAAWLLGGSVLWACFLGNLACLMLFIYGLLRLYSTQYSIHFASFSGYLYVFLVLFITYSCTLGGNNIIYATFICSTLGKALVPLALALFIQKKYLYSLFLLGISSWFQVLVGLQVALVLCFLQLVLSKNIYQSLRLFAWYCVCAAPILVPIFYAQFFKTDQLSILQNHAFADILYYFRNPNHYVPTQFGGAQYAKFAAVVACAVLYLRHQKNTFVSAFCLICLGAMCVYFVGFELLNISVLAKLQWFKASIWVVMLCCIPIANALSTIFLQGINALKIRLDSHLSYLLSYLKYGIILLPINIVLMYMVLQCSVYAPLTDLQKMHFWIKKNTPIDAQILTDVQNTSFACEAQRSQPISYKAVIHEVWFMIEWKQRIDDLYHNQTPARHKADLKMTNLPIEMIKKYGIDYILYEKTDALPTLQGTIIHQQANYYLINPR
jgi:hypothetical protein